MCVEGCQICWQARTAAESGGANASSLVVSDTPSMTCCGGAASYRPKFDRCLRDMHWRRHFEDPSLKHQVFAEIASHVNPDALPFSNTAHAP